MKNEIKNGIYSFAMVIALLGMSACSRQVKSDPEVNASVQGPGPITNTTLEAAHFSYDSNALSSSAQAALNKTADWLKSHPKNYVQIEGNTDERGSAQYNIALGERRAIAVRDYLVSRGVDSSHLGIISYGAERPVDTAHNEAAWAENRRAVPMVVEEAKLAR